MKINEIIRENRKQQSLTQEQVAMYIGVSTPAVCKWEGGTSYPDITILPALARLLKVDLNTLLSFNEDLTLKEVGDFTNMLPNLFQEEGYEKTFETAMAKIQEYPNCDSLIYMVTTVLQGGLVMFGVEDKEKYSNEIEKLYNRLLKSGDMEIKYQATSMLISNYMTNEQYEKANELIESLPNPTVDKKQLQSSLYIKKGEFAKASELLEQELMKEASKIQTLLLKLVDISIKEEKFQEGEQLAKVHKETTKLYDLWDYSQHIAEFQLAVALKDSDKVIELLKAMMKSLETSWDFGNSPLYSHITPKQNDPSFLNIMRQSMVREMKTEKEFEFLREDNRFLEIIELYS